MSKHYSKYANSAFRVEYIGRKPRNDCIKTIQVGDIYTPIDFLLFSPDGMRILSNSMRGLCVWDVTSGELIAGPLAGNDDSSVLSAAYSLDGKCIISIIRSGIITKWDIFTGRIVWEREIDKREIDLSQVVSAVFSPNIKSIVLGDDQGIIGIWNVDTGMQDGELLWGCIGFINCLSFSSDGQYLASRSDDTEITILDMDRREIVFSPFRRRTRRVTAPNASPSENGIVSGSGDGAILLWSASTGEMLHKIKCENEVYSIAHSPDGHIILAGGYGWMNMWNVVDGTSAPKVFQVDGDIRHLSFSPDGNRFAFTSGRDKIQIWDAPWGVEEIKSTSGEQGQITSISLSPGGKLIASGSDDGSVCLWNVLTGEFVDKLQLHSRVESLSFSPINEQLIAFGSRYGAVRLWDVKNDVVVTVGNHKRSIRSIAFSPPDGTYVVSGSEDKTIRIWSIKRRELAVSPLTGHDDEVTSIAYSPNGTRLVSGSKDKTVRVWNSETGQLLSTLKYHSSWVCTVAYSFDGSRIVSGSDDETIIVWDAESGQIVCGPIITHERSVTSVCLSPDGKQILSGSWDGTVRVWDAHTGQSLFPLLRRHTHWVNFICLFPNERHFATVSKDGTIRIWTLDTVPNETTWELRDDNWVVGESGKLLMWIPNDLRRYLCGHRNISILNRPFYLKLHFGPE